MIIMYEKAKILATKAHEGQTRWDPNVPYITHPLEIADKFSNPLYKTVAVLHDVVEDTSITLEFLRKQFPSNVVDAIDEITHRDDESYDQYIMRVMKNPIARIVKVQDIKHNVSSLPDDGATKTRLRRERYSLALILLDNHARWGLE
jgi:(p)ppGpp synthase/HD superfamily hydrolase